MNNKLFSLLVLSFWLIACSEKGDDVPNYVCTTGTAIDITRNSALLKGYLTSKKELTSTVACKFRIGIAPNTLVDQPDIYAGEVGSTGGPFFVTVSELEPNTTYYYQGVVNLPQGDIEGEIKSFTTLDYMVTAETEDAVDVRLATASLKGSVKTENTEGLTTEAWFLYSTYASTVEQLKVAGTKVVASLDGGVLSAELFDLKPATLYYFIAYAKVSGKESYGNVCSFETDEFITVDNWAVDMGLSVKWSYCNLGALSPEQFGNYYAWGETEPKSEYSWSTYKWCNGSKETLTKYNNDPSFGSIDNLTNLEQEDNAARVNLGDSWTMPTEKEWDELLNTCSWSSGKLNGTNVLIATSSTTGNSIYFPCPGYMDGSIRKYGGQHAFYWIAQRSYEQLDGTEDSATGPWALYRKIDWGYPGLGGWGSGGRFRYYGFSVRPVTK